MDIGSISMDLSSAKLMQGVEISVIKKAMNMEELAAETVQEMMPPPSNHILDIMV